VDSLVSFWSPAGAITRLRPRYCTSTLTSRLRHFWAPHGFVFVKRTDRFPAARNLSSPMTITLPDGVWDGA